MSKKLFYDEGPLIMTCGVAGQFKLGVPKEVPDDLAEILLRKGRLKVYPPLASAKPPAQPGPAAPEAIKDYDRHSPPQGTAGNPETSPASLKLRRGKEE
jgi:hypothetical protein